MTKNEIRMTNQTANPNDEKVRLAFRHCRFVIDSSFGFRHSDF